LPVLLVGRQPELLSYLAPAALGQARDHVLDLGGQHVAKDVVEGAAVGNVIGVRQANHLERGAFVGDSVGLNRPVYPSSWQSHADPHITPKMSPHIYDPILAGITLLGQRLGGKIRLDTTARNPDCSRCWASGRESLPPRSCTPA